MKWISGLYKSDEREVVMLMAIFFLLPTSFSLILTPLMLLWVIYSFVTLKKTDYRYAFRTGAVQLSLFFFMFHALSLLWTTNLRLGVSGLETKISFLLVPVLMFAQHDRLNQQGAVRILKSFILGNVFTAVLAFVIALVRIMQTGNLYFIKEGSTFKSYYFLYEALSAPFMHPGYLSTYIGIAILGSMYFFFTEKQSKAIWLAIAFLLFVTMIFLQGRINILAIFMVFGLGALIAAIRMRAFKLLLAPLLAVLLFAGVLIFSSEGVKSRFFEMPDLSYDIQGDHFTSATYRLAEWSSALMAIEKAPWLGHGIGDAHPELVSVYQDRGFKEGVKRKFNAHNQYLEIMLALGVAGLAVFVLLIFSYAKPAFRSGNMLLLAVLFFFLLCMITESMLQRAWGVVLFNSIFPLLSLLPAPDSVAAQKAKTK